MMRVFTSAPVLLIATVMGVLLAMPMALLGSGRARPGEIALMIAPPWIQFGGAAEVVRAAGGRDIGPLRVPIAVLAVRDGRLMTRVCGISINDNRRGASFG